MRAVITTAILACVLAVTLSPSAGRAQGISETEAQALREEIRRLNERLNRIEQAGQLRAVPAAPAPAAAAPSPAVPNGAITPVAQPSTAGALTAQQPAPVPGEKEINLREGLLQTVGLPKLEVGGARFTGFVVGSANFNSHAQIVPEFAGGAQALSEPNSLNFRFDKFGLGVTKTFADWLSAGAAVEIESHRDKHSHPAEGNGDDPRGCPPDKLCERFGAEEATTEVTLDKFNLTAVAPIGNGLAISLARFDLPFGFERHDEILNLTATTSEVFQFGRPQRGTGLHFAYQFAPWLDAQAWVVNRWENETTHDPFDDNNRDKTYGGRIAFTPFAQDNIVNFGVGASWGPEQDSVNRNPRWVIDVDAVWQPTRRLMFASELVYGGEQGVSTREVGIPVGEPSRALQDRNWLGFYILGYYEMAKWLGLTARYGYFNDMDGSRTGVEQELHSFTLAPVLHLSRLIPDLKPTGAFFTRSRVPIDWVNVKLEYRLNHSNRNVFSDSKPGTAIINGDDTSHQVQLQVNVNF